MAVFFPWRLAVLVAFLVAVTAGPPGGRAAEPRAAADTPAASIREVSPELFYVEDDTGRLVPVPGFRYRDFVDLFRIKEGLSGPLEPPAAILESVVVRIDARTIAAARDGDDLPDRSDVVCPATVEFTVRQTRGDWTLVPLELGGLLLSAPPRHEGPGRMLVDVDPSRTGYRAWFDAVPEDGGDLRHTAVLEGRIAVDSTAAAETFTLRMPGAVASRVEIRSSRSAPSVGVHPEAADRTVEAEPQEGGSTVSLGGLAGVVRIRIGAAREDRDGRGVAADVVTESIVRIDGRNAITEAVVRLGNLPPDTSRIRLSLPPRTTLREVQPPTTVIARGGTDEAPTVDLAIDVGDDGFAVVDLACERSIDPSGSTSFEAVGFAVEGITAWRQWGRVSLLVDGDWRVGWSDDLQLRRVDPPANVRQQGFVAAFAYDAQPATLPLEVRPRRSRVVIEPEYRYEVGSGRVALQARFRVAARGAPVSSITIAIDPAWSVDEVGPAGSVDVAAVTSESGEIVIPFAQALAGDTVVEVRASRPLPKDASRVEWQLPVPRADLVGPAVVVIASQSDIELLPDNEGISGLVRQTAAAVPLVDADKTALVYRLDAVGGTFAAARRFLPRRVEATVAAQARLDSSAVVVEQTIRLNVLHVPLEFIELMVPRSIIEAGSLAVRQGDELLDMSEVDAETDAETDAERIDAQTDAQRTDAQTDAERTDEVLPPTTCLRAVLPTPLLGAGEITVQFRLPRADVPMQSTIPLDLPLALPVAATIGRQTVAVAAPDSVLLGVRGEAWRRDVVPAAASAPAWSTAKPQHVIPLTVSARGADAARSTVIEAAWLQTRLAPGIREEIRSYVVSTAESRITIALPEAVSQSPAGESACEVRLDGELVTSPRDGRLVVELPRADPSHRWRLDIRTTGRRDGGWAEFAARCGLPGGVVLAPAVFESPVLERRFYWSIHARPDDSLLGVPGSWTSQQAWRASSLGWRLVPAVTPAELADWVDAVACGPSGARDPVADVGGSARMLPPLAESSFVYSGVGSPGTATAWLVPQWCVVLLASGLTLAAGLVVTYRVGWRRPRVLVAAVATVGLAAAAAPELAPLVAQAALPGMSLAILAWVLKAIVDRPSTGGTRGSVPLASASSLARPRLSAPSLIVGAAVEQGSTATHVRGA